MNITLTGNNDRQNDKAMAMVGQAPEGAKSYRVMVDARNGRVIHGSTCESGPTSIQGPFRNPFMLFGSIPYYVVCLEATSLEQAKEHAAEVMASYLED